MKKTHWVSCAVILLAVVNLCPNILSQDNAAVNQQNNIMTDGRIVLAAMISLSDNHIKKVGDTLELLSQTQEACSGDWEKIKPLLEAAEKSCVPATFWFVHPDGAYHTVEKGLTGQNLKDRDYFPNLMAGPMIVDFCVVRKYAGNKSLICASPIIKEGKVIGALGASIFLEQLKETLKKEMNIPDDLIFYALNEEGILVMNWKAGRVFLDPTLLGSDSLTSATKEMMNSKEGVVVFVFEGMPRRIIYQTSPFTNWRFALGHIIKD